MDTQPISSLSNDVVDTLIEGIHFLKDLRLSDLDQFEMLLNHSRLITLEQGELLTTRGDHGQEIYFLASGHIDVFAEEQPSDKALNTLAAGEIIAALSIINGQPRTATLAASRLDKVEVARVIATEFTVFGELHDFTKIKLATKIQLLRQVISSIRFKITTYQTKYPNHRLASSRFDVERFKSERDTVEELDSLADQAYVLTQLLDSWNEETESQLNVTQERQKTTLKSHLFDFINHKK